MIRPARAFRVPGDRYGNPEYCAMRVTPRGRVLVAMRSNPHQLSRWDPATSQLEASWRVGIDRVAITPRGDLAALVGGSTLSFFSGDQAAEDRSAKRLVRVDPEGWFPGWTTCVLGFSEDGRSLALATQAGGFAVLDVESGQIRQKISSDRYYRDCVLVDGLLLATHDGGRRGPGGMRLWSVTGGREIGRLKFPMSARLALLGAGRVAFGGKTRHIGVVRPSSKGLLELRFLDPSGGPPRTAGPDERPLAHRLPVVCLAASPGSLYTGGGVEASGSGSGTSGELRRWEAKSLRLLEVVDLPLAPVAIAPHPRGAFVLTLDGTVHVLELEE